MQWIVVYLVSLNDSIIVVAMFNTLIAICSSPKRVKESKVS